MLEHYGLWRVAAVFVLATVLTFVYQRRRGVSLFDSLHRGTVVAIATTLVYLLCELLLYEFRS